MVELAMTLGSMSTDLAAARVRRLTGWRYG